MIDRDDLLGNAMRRTASSTTIDSASSAARSAGWEWGMTPMTINAYSNPTMDEIVFPAAILQPPFFDPNADPAVNYGGIGAVIGHEIGHQFDDQGAKYDLHGNLVDWWTRRTRRVSARLDKLEQQYQRLRAAARACT